MLQLDGQAFARGEAGYEEARRATVWNGRLPDRFPDVVVQATSVADVQAAVRYAKSEGLQVGVRSGGHSWAANHVRDGGVLLDVSRLDEVRLDAAGHSAVVGPGVTRREGGAIGNSGGGGASSSVVTASVVAACHSSVGSAGRVVTGFSSRSEGDGNRRGSSGSSWTWPSDDSAVTMSRAMSAAVA